MFSSLFNLYSVIVITTAANVLKYDYSKAVDFKTLPTPDQLVLDLTEDEFDDYLDYWLDQQFLDSIKNQKTPPVQVGCTIPIRSLNERLPVYITDKGLLKPNGTSGNLVLSPSQGVGASCTGSEFKHSSFPNKQPTAILFCDSGTSVSPSWTSNSVYFADVVCLKHPIFKTVKQSTTCLGGGIYINSILTYETREFSIFSSCFHELRAEVLYVEYEQNPENILYQSKVTRPNPFIQGTHFPNLNVNQLYSKVSQRAAFDVILGPSMNEKYIYETNSVFLARGHLAALTDYVLAPEQRATCTFINTAPQWQSFNGGNWNTLEQSLRKRIGEAGYRTKIYTGTWGILKLPDSSGIFRDIYLSPETQQIPVPMWFYKVVHEPTTRRGVVFLGLNNPHVTLAEAKKLAFCTDICTNNPAFGWLKWKATTIINGFGICCEVDDFRKTVDIIPPFTTSGILS